MPHTMSRPYYKPNHEILTRLRKRVGNPVDLLEISSRSGVTPSTLRKILAGGPVSRFVEKKIGPVLEEEGNVRPALWKRSSVERLLEVYRLYQQKGTLQAVGGELGLSRERVRQLLRIGMEAGLFEYKPSNRLTREISITKEKILDDYECLLNLKAVAQANKVSRSHLCRLLKFHRIADCDLKQRRIAGKKRLCIARYDTVVRSLGYHPTTTELQQVRSTRSIGAQIRKFWGSIDVFRAERGIELLQCRRRVGTRRIAECWRPAPAGESGPARLQQETCHEQTYSCDRR